MSLANLTERLNTKEAHFTGLRKGAELLAGAKSGSESEVQGLEGLLRQDENEKYLIALSHKAFTSHTHAGQPCSVPADADRIVKGIHSDIKLHREILSLAETAERSPARKLGDLADLEALVEKGKGSTAKWRAELEKLAKHAS